MASSFCKSSILPDEDVAFWETKRNEIDQLLSSYYDQKGNRVSPLTMLLFILSAGFLAKTLIHVLSGTPKEQLSRKSANACSKLSKPSWGDVCRYRLDSYFSSNRWAKTLLLLCVTLLLIWTGACLIALASSNDAGFEHSLWLAWTYVADPGTHAEAEGTWMRIVSLGITIGGMLIFALMIGIISEEICGWVDGLKKGTSRCIELDHTILLGWTDKSIAIIQELALANLSEGGGVIVVLSTQDKQSMEETLYSALQTTEHPLQLHGSKVVFRSGNPLEEHQLHKVSISTAQAIIALSPDGVVPDEADSRMVRQVLSIQQILQFSSREARGPHVVVELQDIDNKELIEWVAPGLAEVVVAHDIIGRLMIQCAREPSLAFLLEHLLGFEGSEFYVKKWEKLVGLTFGEITCRFDDAVPVGIKCAAQKGKIVLNPSNDHVIEKDDAILCLAEDNDSYTVNNGHYYNATRKTQNLDSVELHQLNKDCQSAFHKEKLLFCGWRRDMYDMIMQLEAYVEEGSELWLFNTVDPKDRRKLLSDGGRKEELLLKNLTLCHVVGNPLVRRDLKTLQALDEQGQLTGKIAKLDEFDSILILSDETNREEMQSCDSQSLVSLLMIQDIQRQLHAAKIHNNQRRSKLAIKPLCNPISEILDSRTRGLLRVANCKGYIMSNQIVSSMLAQVAEDRDMNAVLSELLAANGSETNIKNVSCYFSKDELLAAHSFWDICLRGRLRQETVVGYKPKDVLLADSQETIWNPAHKSQPRQWQCGDSIIVISLHNLK